MITANELRIGNWMQDTNEDYIQVDRICKDGINYQHNMGGDVYSDDCMHGYIYLNPIPLTPELLEKCGFSRVSNDFYIIPGALLINIDGGFWWTNGWEASDDFLFEPTVPYRGILFLHQLQNLFWILTNQELTINL